jgi:hypothetical protein
MIFAFALLHFVAIPWSAMATVTVYAIPAAWIGWLVWQSRASLKLTVMDMLFMAFMGLLLLSMATAPESAQEPIRKYIRYVPFMMLAPYLCGRLMRLSDIRLL